MTVVWGRVDSWHTQKYVLCANFLTILSLELWPWARILFYDWEFSDFLLAPDLVFFVYLGLFFRCIYRLLHLILLFVILSFGFGNIFLADFGLNFSKWFCNLFSFIIRISNTSRIEHTALERILNHLHLFLLASYKLFKGHNAIVIEHFFCFFKLFQKL